MELENKFVLIVFPSALGSVSLAFLKGSFCQESLWKRWDRADIQKQLQRCYFEFGTWLLVHGRAHAHSFLYALKISRATFAA